VEGLFEKHGQKIVMIARFMPGVRAVTYFTAGSVGMPYWRFILWDGLAALLSAPMFVFLGFHFGSELDFLIDKIKEGQTYVLTGMAVIAAGWFLWRWRKAAALRTQVEQGGALASVVPVIPQESSSRPTPFLDAAEKKVVAGRTRSSELQK
jgi:membrane protein DedA with SNARE-associated domain